jgi:thioredoxin reductase
VTERVQPSVIVIGAGPVGLAAAAHLVARGLTPLILERGPAIGTSLRAWGHVRVFSPWEYNIDSAARLLLEDVGWIAPDPKALPTGSELIRDYLAPLARHPAIAPHLVRNAAVTAIARAGIDKPTSKRRAEAPFVVCWHGVNGEERRAKAGAVVDASGTWDQPNPMGIDGLPVAGERAAADRIAYGSPDVLEKQRETYRGKHVLVVGSGHSAINVALDLLRLRDQAPATRVTWALRGNRIDKLIGGGINDQLPERGALGLAAKRAIEARRLTVLAPFAAERIERTEGGLVVTATLDGRQVELTVDRIIVATGFRPDLTMLRELRVALDPAVEATPALAPLIDPNLHSCGTVPPHGAAELAHPEPGFYIVGSKSYGRAPTFLMATGYEQVRSVVAEIAGDHIAARDVRLVLPETGVCSVNLVSDANATAACCGGPTQVEATACCAADADAKAAGKAGCGCPSPPEPAATISVASCRGVPA